MRWRRCYLAYNSIISTSFWRNNCSKVSVVRGGGMKKMAEIKTLIFIYEFTSNKLHGIWKRKVFPPPPPQFTRILGRRVPLSSLYNPKFAGSWDTQLLRSKILCYTGNPPLKPWYYWQFWHLSTKFLGIIGISETSIPLPPRETPGLPGNFQHFERLPLSLTA